MPSSKDNCYVRSQFQNVVSQLRIMLTQELSVPAESVFMGDDGVDGAGGDRFGVGATGSGH